MAWHVARLVSIGVVGGNFPPLEDLTGEHRPDRSAQTGAVILHNVKLLKAAMRARKGNDG